MSGHGDGEKNKGAVTGGGAGDRKRHGRDNQPFFRRGSPTGYYGKEPGYTGVPAAEKGIRDSRTGSGPVLNAARGGHKPAEMQSERKGGVMQGRRYYGGIREERKKQSERRYDRLEQEVPLEARIIFRRPPYYYRKGGNAHGGEGNQASGGTESL